MLARPSVVALVLFATGLPAAQAPWLRLLLTPAPWTETIGVHGSLHSGGGAETEQGPDLAIHRLSANTDWRLFADERWTWVADAKAEQIELDSDGAIVFQRSGTALPEDLTGFGGSISSRLIDSAGRRWVGNLSIASLSDEPFDTDDEITIGAFAAVHLPTGRARGWSLGLGWRSRVEIPLPLVSYSWMPNEEWILTLGFPASFARWSRERWDASLAVFGGSPNAELGYRILRPLRLSARIGRGGWTALIADRSDEDRQLELDQWQASLTLQFNRDRQRQVKLALGVLFGRELTESEGWALFDDTEDETIDLDPAPFVALEVDWVW